MLIRRCKRNLDEFCEVLLEQLSNGCTGIFVGIQSIRLFKWTDEGHELGEIHPEVRLSNNRSLISKTLKRDLCCYSHHSHQISAQLILSRSKVYIGSTTLFRRLAELEPSAVLMSTFIFISFFISRKLSVRRIEKG